MDTPLKTTIIFDNTTKVRAEFDDFRKEFDDFNKAQNKFYLEQNKINNIISKYSHLFVGYVLGPS